MQKSGVNRNPSLKVAIPQAQQSLRRLGFCSQIATGGSQQSSPIVFPEKRNKKVKASSRRGEVTNDPQVKPKPDEHRIDIGGGDEKSDLLGSLVYAGKLVLDKRKSASGKDATEIQQPAATDISIKKAVDAKLTSSALVWGSDMLQLNDVVSVTYNVGLRHFTVHAYPIGKGSCGLSCFTKPKRSRKDFRFVAPTVEEAVQWVASFGDQQCFINCLPHPLVAKKQASSELFSVPIDTPPELVFRCKSAPKMLVILNPRSGHGRSIKVFHNVVEPIFKLAGIKMEVVKTTKAGHARELASTVDINLCSDGIICVGGDGIINEVLNGLLTRSNPKEGVSIPIGIVPAGSDNSLVWTVLGVRDPISAALSIVKGGLTATDVFAVEWIHTGIIHFGMTVSYYGFVSDVLELSEKYQKRFGPLRYFVAGFLKFMCLPKYSYEVEYLPAQKEDAEGKIRLEKEAVDMQDLYTDVMRRSSREGFPRASSLSSIDSIMTPSVGELDTCSSTHASTEPSEYVRGIDPKMKRLSSGRRDVTAEPEVIHPQAQSTTPNWPRTRSKSRMDKGWMGLTSVQDPPTRCSWGNTGGQDREDISSTVSDPGIVSQIPQPQTPREPMKFLSRSWSLSASEISKALAQKQRQQRDLFSVSQNSPRGFFQDVAADPLMAENIMNSAGTRRSGRLSKWFHHKQHTNPSTMRIPRKKDKARVQKAHVHSAVSIAALAAGLASVTSEESCSKESCSMMALALASATELLASHCIDMAEQAGADHTCVASTVRSSVDIHSPGDLMTLTAAAATALRGEAALKVRQPKESRKNATITPCERSFSDSHWPGENCQFRLEEPNLPLEGELVQCARNGLQRNKRVCVYINKKSQVMIKLKSKHVGGAFSKKIKCVVYGVCDEISAWPCRKERENSEEVYFGLKTGQGLLEFKCKSKIQKQRWVAGIQSNLRLVSCLEAAKCSLESLSLSNRMR